MPRDNQEFGSAIIERALIFWASCFSMVLAALGALSDAGAKDGSLCCEVLSNDEACRVAEAEFLPEALTVNGRLSIAEAPFGIACGFSASTTEDISAEKKVKLIAVNFMYPLPVCWSISVQSKLGQG